MPGRSCASQIAVLILVFLAGCGRNKGFEKDDVRVFDLKLTRLQSGAKIITGRIENGSARDVAGLQIQVSLFDSDNRRIDAMSIVVRNLGAGEARSFREPVDSDLDVAGVRVRSLLFP